MARRWRSFLLAFSLHIICRQQWHLFRFQEPITFSVLFNVSWIFSSSNLGLPLTILQVFLTINFVVWRSFILPRRMSRCYLQPRRPTWIVFSWTRASWVNLFGIISCRKGVLFPPLSEQRRAYCVGLIVFSFLLFCLYWRALRAWLNWTSFMMLNL